MKDEPTLADRIQSQFGRDLRTLQSAMFSESSTIEAIQRGRAQPGAPSPGATVKSLVTRHLRLTLMVSTETTLEMYPNDESVGDLDWHVLISMAATHKQLHSRVLVPLVEADTWAELIVSEKWAPSLHRARSPLSSYQGAPTRWYALFVDGETGTAGAAPPTTVSRWQPI